MEYPDLEEETLFFETQVPQTMRNVAISIANNDVIDGLSDYYQPLVADLRSVTQSIV